MWFWPTLRGQAGPAPDTDGHESEPGFDSRLELISVPADVDVKHSQLSFRNLLLIFRSIRIPFMSCYGIFAK